MDKVKVQENSCWARKTHIGKGAYGTVSLAVNKSNGAVFAVKSVDTNSSLPCQVDALENEIGILRSLSSPYVVEYLGDDTTVEMPGVTSFRNLHMEYLPGGSVADAARECLDERIIKDFTFCIVSGLTYLHREGIVHCDVKCENVLVGPTPGTAKLADFGSAMITGSGSGNKNKIMPRGSPLWMSPEVIRGEYQGPESDVWSLGCTVIEMFTGKPAWSEGKGGAAAAETLCRIGYSDELPRLPTQISELGRDFLDKCLRREVNERWSCDQLLQHPFISTCSSSSLSTYSSPRCVLDWFNLDFDEDESDPRTSTRSSSICDYSEVKGRIGKLASGRGAIWESDGWVEVRGLLSEREEVSVSPEGEGTSSAYLELMGIEGEVSGAELENGDSIGIGNDSLVDGVVTDSNEPGYEREWDDKSQACRRDFLVILYYLFFNFYRIKHTMCGEYPDSISVSVVKFFCYIFFCISVCAIQQFYVNLGNFLSSHSDFSFIFSVLFMGHIFQIKI